MPLHCNNISFLGGLALSNTNQAIVRHMRARIWRIMKLSQFTLSCFLNDVKSLAWNMAKLRDFNSLNAIKTFIYPRVTVCQMLLGITYHASCLKE